MKENTTKKGNKIPQFDYNPREMHHPFTRSNMWSAEDRYFIDIRTPDLQLRSENQGCLTGWGLQIMNTVK